LPRHFAALVVMDLLYCVWHHQYTSITEHGSGNSQHTTTYLRNSSSDN